MHGRILLALADREVGRFIKRGLEAEGHHVVCVQDAAAVAELASTEPFELLVLDDTVHDAGQGEVPRRVGSGALVVSTLMLTSRSSRQSPAASPACAADAKLMRPFSFDVLLARVGEMLARQGRPAAAAELRVGDLRLDRVARRAWRGERTIALTAREFTLLNYLMIHAGKAVSRTRLLSQVWGLHFDPGTRIVDVYVRYLRLKLDRACDRSVIRTVRGVGYRLDVPDPEP